MPPVMSIERPSNELEGCTASECSGFGWHVNEVRASHIEVVERPNTWRAEVRVADRTDKGAHVRS